MLAPVGSSAPAASPRPPGGGSEALMPTAGEGEEMVTLLEDGRQEADEERGRVSTQRHSGGKERAEKHEKRRSRGGGAHGGCSQDGWNVRENFWWLWGGSPHAGLLCMLTSALLFSFMGLLVKLLSVHAIPSFETVFVRCAVIAALSALCLHRIGHPLLGAPTLRLLLLARAVLGFIALSAFFYSIQVLPLRDATLISFTLPVFTAIIASVFLDEKFTSREIAGSACCLLGVLMVTQPPIVFGGPLTQQDDPSQRHESLVGVLVALLAALVGAVALCLVRSIGKAGEQPLAVVFVFAAFSCPASFICLLLFQGFVMPSASELVGMLLVGVTAFAAQVLLTRGLQLEKAGRASAMQYIKVVGTFFLGLLFLSERLSLKSAAGTVLICAATAFIAVGDRDGRADERA
ncbi:unnamed protein product [Closterium sp. Naga37s-1]|nr:unnamed protein product [Closterium sp. Naga37s-1]